MFRIAAFLGRYGHQPFDVFLRCGFQDMLELQEAVCDILNDESEQARVAEEID